MSDIRKLLDIINETTVAGSVATVAAPMGEVQKRVEETATEETKNPEVIEYGMWENSALATTSKLKKNRGKSAKVVKSIYGEDVQSEAANTKQQAAIAIAKKKEVAEGKFTINAKTGAKLDPRTGAELPSKEKPLTMKDMFRQPKSTAPKLSLDDVWMKIQSVVSNIYPDGDPIDHLAPWLEKHGIRDFKIGEILDRAAKKNGYKDLYDYWDSMGDLPLSEQGVAEGKLDQLPTQGADYSQYDTDHLRTLLKPGILHRNEARFKALIRKELRKREQQGVAEGSSSDKNMSALQKVVDAAAKYGFKMSNRSKNGQKIILHNTDFHQWLTCRIRNINGKIYIDYDESSNMNGLRNEVVTPNEFIQRLKNYYMKGQAWLEKIRKRDAAEKNFVGIRVEQYPYGKPSSGLRAAVKFLNRNGKRGHKYFDFPEYADIPDEISSELMPDEVDFIQDRWDEVPAGKQGVAEGQEFKPGDRAVVSTNLGHVFHNKTVKIDRKNSDGTYHVSTHWNEVGADVPASALKKSQKQLSLKLDEQGVAEGSEDRKTAPGWHSDSVKNPNFNDELSGRRVSPPGKRLKSGKLSADERGSQERTKALMKFKKAQGGLTGPKGVLPEQDMAEGTLEESDLILNPASLSKLSRDLVSHEHDRTDHEVEMAKSDLYQAGKNAVKIFELIKDISEEEGLEGWVQEKIIKANDYLNTIREYLEGKQMESMDGVAPGTKMFTSEEKPGLWANIHAKRKRIKSGSGERMRKPGSKGAPSAQDFKDAAK